MFTANVSIAMMCYWRWGGFPCIFSFISWAMEMWMWIRQWLKRKWMSPTRRVCSQDFPLYCRYTIHFIADLTWCCCCMWFNIVPTLRKSNRFQSGLACVSKIMIGITETWSFIFRRVNGWVLRRVVVLWTWGFAAFELYIYPRIWPDSNDGVVAEEFPSA